MDKTIQQIKHNFMAMRNGIIADTLRQAGMDCYHIIFGLNLPQLTQIAQTLEPSMELAVRLWSDENVRESRLLACYLFPPTEIDLPTASKLCEKVRTQEEADILAFRLLRHLPFVGELASLTKGYARKAQLRYT